MQNSQPSSPERDSQTYAVIGAAMAVHGGLGCGFLEAVYLEGMTFELMDRGIAFKREVRLPIRYKGVMLPCSYRVDLICFGSVLVELKALSGMTAFEHAQMINYLRASECSRGLLLNFGAPSLQYKRFVLSGNQPLPHVIPD